MKEHPLPTFDPRRPTSAILREYKEYKRQEEERKAAAALQRELTTTNDASVIIRQISPQARPSSPVSQRRADFIKRVQTPASKHRDHDTSDVSTLPPRAGKLRRTDSEKFPSVSRTTSFKELPEHELQALQENSLLTAAERIELEKNKRDAENKPPPKPKPETSDATAEFLPKPERLHDERDDKKREKKGRRRLPSTPHPGVTQEVEIGDDHVTANVQLFTQAVLRVDSDVDMINKVKLANVDDDLIASKAKASQQTGDVKHEESGASYMPVIKQRSASGLSSVPFPNRMNISSTLTSKDMWPKVSKRMEFNYENFTRAPPDTTAKKRLEMKARQRKKIQQKNAQLEEERRQRLQTAIAATKPTGADERPPTRVSFNENVIVFQTI